LTQLYPKSTGPSGTTSVLPANTSFTINVGGGGLGGAAAVPDVDTAATSGTAGGDTTAVIFSTLYTAQAGQPGGASLYNGAAYSGLGAISTYSGSGGNGGNANSYSGGCSVRHPTAGAAYVDAPTTIYPNGLALWAGGGGAGGSSQDDTEVPYTNGGQGGGGGSGYGDGGNNYYEFFGPNGMYYAENSFLNQAWPGTGGGGPGGNSFGASGDNTFGEGGPGASGIATICFQF